MEPNIFEIAWSLFLESRKEILEYQKIRAQIIGFKITFVSTGIGLILANRDKVTTALLVLPAFSSVFFDFLITSYSYSIKRTGYYCLKYVEPVIRDWCKLPARSKFPLWEEFMMMHPEARQHYARIGNIGISFLAIVFAAYGVFSEAKISFGLSILITVVLVAFLCWDALLYRLPKKFRGYAEAKAASTSTAA